MYYLVAIRGHLFSKESTLFNYQSDKIFAGKMELKNINIQQQEDGKYKYSIKVNLSNEENYNYNYEYDFINNKLY